jgi:peptidyl-dipeptidase Dcp
MSDQTKVTRLSLGLMLGAGLAALSVTGCATTAAPAAPPTAAAPVAPLPPAPVEETNPLLQTVWTTPYGAPPFDKIKPEHYAPAFDAGMAAQNKEIAAILADAAAPTFANTIEAMERSGALLARATTVFYNLTSTHTNDALDKLETEYSPKLTAHSSAIYLNGDLFKRVEAVWKTRTTSGLSSEQQRLVERAYQDFVRAGARLTPEQKTRMSAIDSALSSLSTEFGQKVRNDEKQYELILEEKDLAGIPAAMRASMAETAKSRGKTGYMVTLQRPSVEPFLTFSNRRDLREKAWRAWAARGDNGDADDTNDTIKKIVALRTERAQLLGFKTYADFALDDRMAKTSEAALP